MEEEAPDKENVRSNREPPMPAAASSPSKNVSQEIMNDRPGKRRAVVHVGLTGDCCGPRGPEADDRDGGGGNGSDREMNDSTAATGDDAATDADSHGGNEADGDGGQGEVTTGDGGNGGEAGGDGGHGEEDGDGGGDEAAYWRDMFRELSRERHTAPERQLRAAREEAADRERALKTYVRHLEGDLAEARAGGERARSELEEARRGLKEERALAAAAAAAKRQREKEEEEEAARDERERPTKVPKCGGGCVVDEETARKQRRQVRAWREKVAAQNATIEMYQMLTATRIGIVEESPHEGDTDGGGGGGAERKGSHPAYDCTMVNHEERIASKFRLTLLSPKNHDQAASLHEANAIVAAAASSDGGDGDQGGGEIRFEPLVNAGNLPDFLRQPIDFERSQCPALLQNILKRFFKEE